MRYRNGRPARTTIRYPRPRDLLASRAHARVTRFTDANSAEDAAQSSLVRFCISSLSKREMRRCRTAPRCTAPGSLTKNRRNVPKNFHNFAKFA